MHTQRTRRLMSNQIIIRKTKAEEKEQGFEYKMFRLTSKITLMKHSVVLISFFTTGRKYPGVCVCACRNETTTL